MIGEEKQAVVIVDNFTGQITASIHALLEANDIHTWLLPPNMTDRLLPQDVSVSKPAKDFLRCKFEEWYTNEFIKELDGKGTETSVLEPIDLSSAILKEQSGRWLVKATEYNADNPQVVVNGFHKTGIVAILDGVFEENGESEAVESSDFEDDEFEVPEDYCVP